jgi:hypothetical protein
VLIAPDAHIPFHDEAAMSCFLAVGRKLRPQRTVILGDFINGTPFSRHAPRSLRETAKRDFKAFEIDPANAILDQIERFTRGEIAYCFGNHESWVERAAAQSADGMGSVFGLIDPAHLLAGHRKRVKVIRYGRDVSLPEYHYEITPNWWAFHEIGHGQHAAATVLRHLPTVSSSFGHVHRVQSVTKRLHDDRLVTAATCGCLAQTRPEYMGGKPSGWAHAFEIGYVSNDLTSHTRYTVTIENGRCILPDGSQVSA